MKTHSSTWVRALKSVILVVVLLLVGILGFKRLKALSTPAEKGDLSPPLTQVHVLKLVPQDYQETLSGYGRVRAMLQTVVSAEIQGVVQDVSPQLEIGAHVEKGTVLVRIGDADYQEAKGRHLASLEQNTIELSRQNAEIKSLEDQQRVSKREFKLSSDELARRIQMFENNVTSMDEVDRQRRATTTVELSTLRIENNLRLARINAKRLESIMKSTRLDISRAQRDIDRCVLKAPFTGVIESKSVQPGIRIAAGTELFRVVDPHRVEVPIALPASSFGDVKVGAEVKLTRTNRPGCSWRAQVTRVSPALQVEDRTYHVFIVIEETEDSSAPPLGAFLIAKIKGPIRKDVLVLPRTSFLDGGVLALAPGHGEKSVKVEELKVKIDHLLPDVILSRDPEARGREVILDNLEQIAAGSLVEVQKDEPSRMNK